LDVSDSSIERITSLAGLINIRYLCISGTHLKDWTDVRRFQNLEYLVVSESNIDSIDLSVFQELPKLKMIAIAHSKNKEDFLSIKNSLLNKLNNRHLLVASEWKRWSSLISASQYSTLTIDELIEQEYKKLLTKTK